MVQRKSLFVVLIFFFNFFLLNADISIQEIEDSLLLSPLISVEQDSLRFLIDSSVDSLIVETDSLKFFTVSDDDFVKTKRRVSDIPAPDYQELTEFCYQEILYNKIYYPNYRIDKLNASYYEGISPLYRYSDFRNPLFHNSFIIDNYIFTNNVLPSHELESKLINYGIIDDNVFNKVYYPYNVTLTRAYAGLGEYDNNFAHVSLRKNHAISIENLHLRTDFKASDRLYKNFNHKSSEGYFQLDYYLNNFVFNAGIILSNRDLLSGDYYLHNLFSTDSDRINDRWELYKYGLGWKYFLFSFVTNEQYIKAYNLDNHFKSENKSLILSYDNLLTNHNIKINLQKDYIKNSNSDKFNQNNISFQHFNQFSKLRLQGEYIGVDNLNKISLNLKTSYTLNSNLDFISNLAYHDNLDRYIDYRVYNLQQHLLSTGLSIRHNKTDLSLLLGQKRVIQNNYIEEIKQDMFTCNLVFNTSIPVKQLKLNISNVYNYDRVRENFILIPEFTNISDISLMLPLEHDNRISLGSRINLIADMIDEAYRVRQTNPLIDSYLNIGISKLFEFEVQFNNMIRNTFFGDKTLHDFNFSTKIVWYFIN